MAKKKESEQSIFTFDSFYIFIALLSLYLVISQAIDNKNKSGKYFYSEKDKLDNLIWYWIILFVANLINIFIR